MRKARPKNKRLFALSQQFGLVATAKPRQELEKIIQASQGFLDVNVWRDKLSELETQVCRIEIGGNPQGTGFLVGSNTVMTNYHVIEKIMKGQASPDDVLVRFDFKIVAIGDRKERQMGTTYALDSAEWLVDKSPYSLIDTLTLDQKQGDPEPNELDFAVLRLAKRVAELPVIDVPNQDTPRPKRGFVKVDDFSAEPAPPEVHTAPNDTIFILQHPRGKPLKLNFNTIKDKNGNQTRIRYTTNTEPGSSGSPCFDRNWRLVALHHSGDPAFSPVFNEGIPLQAIVDLLKQNGTYKTAIGKQTQQF
ncbi:MAG TPA: serine protease [Anaerolineae bacterium]|nr:serine protease [Anaerolineae bacterium]